MLRRTRSVQRLARFFGTNTDTDKQTSCYFSIRILAVDPLPSMAIVMGVEGRGSEE